MLSGLSSNRPQYVYLTQIVFKLMPSIKKHSSRHIVQNILKPAIPVIANFAVSYMKWPLLYLKKLAYAGNQNFCPVCSSHIRGFRPYGVRKRPNAICPVCGSLERHRLVWLYFTEKTELFSGADQKMLHIAPENCFRHRLSEMPHLEYCAGDLYRPELPKIDITDIHFPDHHFDIIYCSHVLEHVPDDRQAMRELLRVLKPSGWAILQVPIMGESTQEDLSITDPEERTRRYGQPDHVRSYGKDYRNRLESAGFQVQVIPYIDQFSHQASTRYGLSLEKDDIYFCTTSSESSLL